MEMKVGDKVMVSPLATDPGLERIGLEAVGVVISITVEVPFPVQTAGGDYSYDELIKVG